MEGASYEGSRRSGPERSETVRNRAKRPARDRQNPTPSVQYHTVFIACLGHCPPSSFSPRHHNKIPDPFLPRRGGQNGTAWQKWVRTRNFVMAPRPMLRKWIYSPLIRILRVTRDKTLIMHFSGIISRTLSSTPSSHQDFFNMTMHAALAVMPIRLLLGNHETVSLSIPVLWKSLSKPRTPTLSRGQHVRPACQMYMRGPSSKTT